MSENQITTLTQIIFKESFDPQALTIRMQAGLNQKCWIVQEFNEWQVVLANLIETSITSLFIGNNFKKMTAMDLLKLLPNIQFTNLTYLNLSSDALTNINTLQQLHCPALIKLCLHRNLIVSIKSMKKYHLHCLEEIILNENLISECGNSGFFENNNLQSLEIQHFTYAYDNKFQNFSFQIKIKSSKKQLTKAIRRILQKKAIEQAKQRLKNKQQFPNNQ